MLRFFFKDSAIPLCFLHFFRFFWYFLPLIFSFFWLSSSKKHLFSGFSFFRKAFTFLSCLVFSFTGKSGFFRKNFNFFPFFLYKSDVFYHIFLYFLPFWSFLFCFSLFILKSSFLLTPFCLFSFLSLYFSSLFQMIRSMIFAIRFAACSYKSGTTCLRGTGPHPAPRARKPTAFRQWVFLHFFLSDYFIHHSALQ